MPLLDELEPMTRAFLDADKLHVAFRDGWATVREDIIRTQCDILVQHLKASHGPWNVEFRRENGASILTMESAPGATIKHSLRFKPNWRTLKVAVVPQSQHEEEFDLAKLTQSAVDNFIKRAYSEFLAALGNRDE